MRPALHLNLTSLALRAIPATVQLDNQGGSGDSAVEVMREEAMPTVTIPSRTGYIFNGYFTGTNGTGDKYYNSNGTSAKVYPLENSPTKLYAYWTPITYNIIYNGNGSTSGSMTNSTHTYDEPKNLTTNAYSRVGYLFTGWSTAPSGAVAYQNGASVKNLSSTNGASITIYASWSPITYSIKYNGAGATSGSMSNSVHTYDVEKNLTANSFVRIGYTMTGWSVIDGGAVTYLNGQAVKNLSTTNGEVVNLYAVWEVNKYTVTFVYNGATGENSIATKQVTYGNFYSDLPQPVKSGSAFAGWYLDPQFTTKITETTEVTTHADHNLYAKWTTWVNIVVSGTSTQVDAITELNSNQTKAEILIYPSAGQYVYRFSFDRTNWILVDCIEATISGVNFAISVTYHATMLNNAWAIDFDYFFANYLEEGNCVNLYLEMTNTNYTSLKQSGGTSISGIVVSATKGGAAMIIGDDYKGLGDNDTITVRASLCLDGYEFVGWYLANNMNVCLSTLESVKFRKSQIYETQLIAFFRPIGSNDDLENTLDNM